MLKVKTNHGHIEEFEMYGNLVEIMAELTCVVRVGAEMLAEKNPLSATEIEHMIACCLIDKDAPTSR